MSKDYTDSHEFQLQDSEYDKPYHYNLRDDSGYGIEYHSYLNEVRNLIPKGTKNILDFGCGEGFFCNMISNDFDEVFGIDLSKKAINIAQKESKGATFLQAPTNEFDKFNFDVITMIEVLEHIEPESINDVITYLHSILSDQGVLIITVPSKNLPLQEKHFQHFDKKSLYSTLSPYFKPEKILGHYKKPSIFYKVIKNSIDNNLYQFRINPINNYLKNFFQKNLAGCEHEEGYRLISVFSKNNGID